MCIRDRSMTSFAATGWAEDDGTWVYYNRDGERATDQWNKSGITGIGWIAMAKWLLIRLLKTVTTIIM